jgi:exonuclease III
VMPGAGGTCAASRNGNPGPGQYTFWDYRQGAFHLGWGLRIDLALATPVEARCTSVTVDRDERKPTAGEGKPSDHAPLIITLTADGRWSGLPDARLSGSSFRLLSAAAAA